MHVFKSARDRFLRKDETLRADTSKYVKQSSVLRDPNVWYRSILAIKEMWSHGWHRDSYILFCSSFCTAQENKTRVYNKNRALPWFGEIARTLANSLLFSVNLAKLDMNFYRLF